MAERFVEVDRNTPMLLPADLRDWVPEDDLVHFVIEAVKTLPTGEFVINERGTGYAQYPPSMMLALLIYCYASGIFSSRRIERASYRDLGVRFLTGDTHPDHDTICSFRRQNGELIAKFFVRVLELARELKLLQVGTLSVDGTRLKANGSKHRGVNYQRSGELIQQLEKEVKELLGKAEQADSQGEIDPATLPQAIAKRQELKAKLEAARQQLEERHRQEFAAKVAQYEKKKEAWEKNDRRGHEPKAPVSNGPDPEAQSNLTDPDSRIMRKSKNEAYVALSAEAHERRPYDLRSEEKRRENPRQYRTPVLVAMEQKLRSPEGRRRYLRRQASIEPVVGIIKKVLGFEQFLLRGLQKVTLEWKLICVAYNLKRLHKLQNPPKPKPKVPKPTNPTSPVSGELLGQLFARYCLAFH
jgi:transposase